MIPTPTVPEAATSVHGTHLEAPAINLAVSSWTVACGVVDNELRMMLDWKMILIKTFDQLIWNEILSHLQNTMKDTPSKCMFAF